MGSLEDAGTQIRALEPVFHHAQTGAQREVFEAVASPEFWEVGASGRVYSREFVIEALLERYSQPYDDDSVVTDFTVRALAPDLYLATYLLGHDGRHTRRSTIWRRTTVGWIAEYHQGTVVEDCTVTTDGTPDR